ncbi:hypothetical protein EDB81DRAFT_794178, partial [Dactylonectria macrodidyma]
MSPSHYEEAAALQALIKANLRVLHPQQQQQQQLEVVTYEYEHKAYACVISLSNDPDYVGVELGILHQGDPGNVQWGVAESLASLFRKTQQLLGEQMQEQNLIKKQQP